MWLAQLITRSLFARRRNNATLFMSAAGIATGILSLTVVLGMMNGLQDLLIKNLIAVDSYEYSGTLSGTKTLGDITKTREVLMSIPGIQTAAAFSDEFALAEFNNISSVLRVRAIDAFAASKDHTFISALFFDNARAQPDSERVRFIPDGISIGWNFASQAGLAAGDSVVLTFPGEGAGFAPAVHTFFVSDIFYTGSEYDTNLAFISLEDYIAALSQQHGSTAQSADISNIRFGMRIHPRAEKSAAAAAKKILTNVQSWKESNRSFYFALKMEKSLLTALTAVIFAVILLHFRFSILRRIRSKRDDIMALRTMGATPQHIQLWFFGESAAIGSVSIVAGLALGAVVLKTYPHITGLLKALLGLYSIDTLVLGGLTFGQGTGIILCTGFAVTCIAYLSIRRAALIDVIQLLHYE